MVTMRHATPSNILVLLKDVKYEGQRWMETQRKDVKNLLYSRRLLMMMMIDDRFVQKMRRTTHRLARTTEPAAGTSARASTWL